MTLERAIEIAVQAHRGQVDKAGLPYILHPLRVMLALGTAEGQMVGVLHDTVEDTGVSLDDLIREGFSHEVVKSVDAVSRRDGETYEKFISRVLVGPITGIRVKMVDLADNMSAQRMAALPPDEAGRMMTRYTAAYRRCAEELGRR